VAPVLSFLALRALIQVGLQIPAASFVVVSAQPLTDELQVQLRASESVAVLRSKLDAEQFDFVEGQTNLFAIEASILGVRYLADRRELLREAVSLAGQGQKIMRMSDLSPRQRRAIVQAARHSGQFIDEGLTHLLESGDFKLALEPVVAATFEAGGRVVRLPAYPVQNQRDLGTAAVVSRAGPTTPKEGPKSVLLEECSIFFGPNVKSLRARLQALQQLGEISSNILATEVANFDQEFRETRLALFQLYRDQMGERPPPPVAEWSQLDKPLQDAFIRTMSGAWKAHGFSSYDDAVLWLQSARMSSSSATINLHFGGVDSRTGRPKFASVPLQRP